MTTLVGLRDVAEPGHTPVTGVGPIARNRGGTMRKFILHFGKAVIILPIREFYPGSAEWKP